MPVEIRKLVIKAVVSGEERKGSSIPGSSHSTTSENDRAIIVEECVKQVLRILKQDKQR